MKKTFRTTSLLLQDTPVFWVTLAFAVYCYYAQFVVTVSWNAIELIIAQHLLDHGTYATSIDYPSALTWRPVLPTLLLPLKPPPRRPPLPSGGAPASAAAAASPPPPPRPETGRP